MANMKRKLFPKKGEQKDKLITSVKSYVRQLDIASKGFNKKAEISRKNAKIALQRGEKERAKNYLIQYQQYQTKFDRTNNIKAKFERQIEAVQEGTLIMQSGNFMGKMRDELKDISTKASPTKIAEISEDSDMYVSEIEEAAELLGGDPSLDNPEIDVDSMLNKLETEVLLEAGGQMPNVPSGKEMPSYITETEGEADKEGEIKSKDKIQEEISKLRKELNE